MKPQPFLLLFTLAALFIAETEARAVGVPGPKVKLITKGKAPYKALRFRPKKGRKQRVMLKMESKLGMAIGGRTAPPRQAPSNKLVIELKVIDVKKNNDIQYEFKVADAEVLESPGTPPRLLAQMRHSVRSTIGTSGSAVVTDTGRSKEDRLTVSKNAAPLQKQMLEGFEGSVRQLSVPFPEEAVGVGAKWVVEMPLEMNSMKMTQKATYELVQLKGNRGKAKLTVEQTAKPQPIALPGLPPGTSARLIALASAGEGMLDFDLTQIVPLKSTLKLDSETKARMENSAAAQSTEMTMIVNLKLSLNKAKPSKKTK